MSFIEIVHMVFKVYIEPWFSIAQKLKDFLFSSLNEYKNVAAPVSLFDNVEIPFEFNNDSVNTPIIDFLLTKYEDHFFDLLGSGWVQNKFSVEAYGMCGYMYSALSVARDDKEQWLNTVLTGCDRNAAKKIFVYVPQDYTPIDWQKDFKSGYRWSAKKWYRPILYANKLGVDIKVPWELSRLEHLTRMAFWAFALPDRREELRYEFQNQCLDFIAQNPVRKGVNWFCTMDVGIRTANLSLTYSIFKSAKCSFPDFFEKRLASSLFSHCDFIRRNLEWSPSCRSNHYLADICGLLWGASVLPDCTQKQKWILFASDEIRRELFLQFNTDGSNFESSVAYHRLSSEMIVFSLALIQYLSSKGFCASLTERETSHLYKIGKFISDTKNPSGNFIQFGDNDSGRFFNLTPIGSMITVKEASKRYKNLANYIVTDKDGVYFDENCNSPDAVLTAINALIGTDFLVTHLCIAEEMIIKALVPYVLQYQKSGSRRNDASPKRCLCQNVDFLYHSTESISCECNITDNLEYIEYPDFGLSVFKSPNLYLAINWSDNGQNGNAGHAHNDKLSYELWLDGKPIAQDPGTFVYTPLPELRDKFRSTTSHNCLQINKEQNEYMTLFSMKNETHCAVVERTSDSVTIRLEFNSIVQQRKFKITNNAIIIDDYSTVPFKVNNHQNLLTAGYGKWLSSIDCKTD